MTPTRPLWLAAPSRVAGMARGRARVTLVAVALLLLLAAAALGGDPVDPPQDLYASVVVAMRHGIPFYDALRGIAASGGEASETSPALALVMTHASLDGMTALLCALLAAMLYAAWSRVTTLLPGVAARLAAAGLLLTGAAAGAALAMHAPQAGWSALLTCWALLLRTPDRWASAAAILAIAAMIDPAATVALVVMAVVALVEGRRRETSGWALALAVAAAAIGTHHYAVHDWPLATDAAIRPDPLALLAQASFPPFAPTLAAVALMLSLAGWAACRGALSIRVLACVATTLAAQAAAGLAAATALAPLVALGIAFLPDAVRDLASAAVARRRRITVTRIRTPAGADR